MTSPTQTRSFFRRPPGFVVLTALATLALLSGAAWVGAEKESPEAVVPTAAVLPVQAVRVRAESGYPVVESYAGRVVSRRTSALGFERSGRLQEVRVDEGQRVEAGQVLAELDSRSLRAQRRQAAAQVAEIEARLSLAAVTTERRRKLRESDHLSPQQFDEAVFSQEALAAQLQAARAAVEALDVSLELSRIEAPYAGVIDARHVDEGTVVGPGEPILELIEDRALEIHIGVSPETAAELAPGSVHTVRVGERGHPARLHAVLSSVEPDTRTVTAIFRLPEDGDDLRSGALARVELSRRIEAEGFWLPLSALAEGRRGLWNAYALLPTEGGQLRVDRRQLDVLHAEADRAFVRGTLQPGERVVLTGLHRLVPDQLVRLDEGSSQSPAGGPGAGLAPTAGLL